MTRVAKLYQQTIAGRTPSFAEFQKLVEAFGFRLERISGSHHIYRHPEIRAQLNLQPVGKDAKAYQVRQFLDMVPDQNLKAPER